MEVPALAVRDMVIFPHMMAPIFMGRQKSIKAAEKAMATEGNYLLLVAQKDPNNDDPKLEDLFETATLASVQQLLRLPDGTVKTLVEGHARYRITGLKVVDGAWVATCTRVVSESPDSSVLEPYRRSLIDAWSVFANGDKTRLDLLKQLEGEMDLERLLDLICSQAPFKTAEKIELLSEANLVKRYEFALNLLGRENELKEIQARVDGRVKRQMDKNQRDYYLNEQMKAIRKELGDSGDGDNDDFAELEKRVTDAKMPKYADDTARNELRRLRQMPPMSSESVVVRNYIETLTDYPWSKKSRVSRDLEAAARILDEDHSGLEKVKERILEYLAVQKRVGKVKSPILCFVGAPGVGKTSLGESIARATGRKYVRVALGGVHDESEIRGHRRTYVGSMPGQIVKGMIRSGVRNPLFLLDEIDKMGSDHRGDPASAMLEVLDPEQNDSFADHYMEVPVDLSDVMFVATSNSYDIPPALLDRMEVISLSGYTEEEKIHIAERHLVPKELRATGLKAEEVDLTREAIVDIIRFWTREAGVRGLERLIGKIFRKIVFATDKQTLKKQKQKAPVKTVVTPDMLSGYLGPARYTIGLASKEPRVGVVNGLAWTSVGGELLTIEAQIFPGKGHVQRTGSLGDVMKESVEAARSVVRARADKLGIESKRFYETDLHVHFPEGATPKDGPSAGAATTTAIISAMTGIPVRADIAMTGEINLHGEVLEIGGLKEKILAAVRAGCTKVLIPQTNVRDLEELPESAKSKIAIVPVKTIDDVMQHALVRQPEALDPKVVEAAKAKAEAKDAEASQTTATA
ncbi:MAG: endopeptidase La [Sutterella wadsworthensis]|nr:endopeptidase La [Sutterella wadsworthensis]